MPVAATAGRPRAAEGARVLQPPATRMLEAVSVESEPLPPNDPLEHRYDARQPGRARPAGAGAAAAPGPDSVEPKQPGPSTPAAAPAATAGEHEDDFDAATALPPPERDPTPARLPASLEEFLAGLGTRAFRFAELGLRHREDALDAVQDAMMKMLGYRDRPPQEWTPLFWSILRSRIVDVQRRRAFRLRWLLPAARGEDDAPADWADDGPDPQRTYDGREAYGRLAQALQTLPRRQREAFSLRVLEELDVATTARAMGCSEGAVKTHLSRAREALQRQLEEWR